MFGLESEKLILILVIILVLFGGKKLPELSRGIGQSLREIKKGLKDDSDDDEKNSKKETKKKTSA